jgi:hypothetical protein
MFVRNGKVTGSVLRSAVPVTGAETPKSAPAKKAAAPVKKAASPVKKSTAPAAPTVTVKEASTVDNDDARK